MNGNTFYKSFSFESPKKALSIMPARRERSNKGDYGRVLCVCGSHGMAGAAYLCAKAAYRTGAGLVEIFTHESNRTALQTSLPEAIVTAYENYTDDSLLRNSLERADVVVVGCGLSVTPTSRRLLSDLLHMIDTEKTPLLLDADALNLLARNPSLLKYARGAVITPHMGEMSRLTGKSIEEILASPADTAFDYAKRHSLICVLKDHRTVVSDGSDEIYTNTTGNSGMSTGGSGDVLAGIVGGILAQRKNSDASMRDLVCLGVYLHGAAGDLAAEHLSEYSVMASDIIAGISRVIKENI